jgi:hypothetical protein
MNLKSMLMFSVILSACGAPTNNMNGEDLGSDQQALVTPSCPCDIVERQTVTCNYPTGYCYGYPSHSNDTYCAGFTNRVLDKYYQENIIAHLTGGNGYIRTYSKVMAISACHDQHTSASGQFFPSYDVSISNLPCACHFDSVSCPVRTDYTRQCNLGW